MKLSKLIEQRYSFLSAVVQPFKVLLIYKLLDFEDAGQFGWLLAFISVFYGISHLGWGDYISKKIVIGNKVLAQENDIVVINFFLIGFLFFLPILIIFRDISPAFTIVLFLDYIFLSLFSHLIKIVRAQGHQKLFFKLLSFKIIIEITFSLIYFAALGSYTVEVPFIIEMAVVFAMIIFILKKNNLIGMFGKSKTNDIAKTYKSDYLTPITLGVNIILSVVLLNAERLLSIEVLSAGVYNKYIFLSSFIGMAYSASALLKNIFYIDLVKESEGSSDLFKRTLKMFILAATPIHVLGILVVYGFLQYFYGTYNISLTNVCLLMGIVFVIIINVYDMIIYYSEYGRKLFLSKFYLLVLILLLFIIARIYYEEKISLNMILFATLFLKTLYLSMSLFWYKKLKTQH